MVIMVVVSEKDGRMTWGSGSLRIFPHTKYLNTAETKLLHGVGLYQTGGDAPFPPLVSTPRALQGFEVPSVLK